MTDRGTARPARTVLEQLIWDRDETLTEFVDYANRFAQETGESGTLSERNLKRLTAGASDSRPRPATTRLLGRIFGIDITELLSSPASEGEHLASENELRTMIASSKRVNRDVIALLHEQLNATRRLDRELGAIVAHDEVKTKIRQVNDLMSHSLTPTIRADLAALLSELHTLAGWQALDLDQINNSWVNYENAKSAARESGNDAFLAHAEAEQAVVLTDIGETVAAVELLDSAVSRVDKTGGHLLRAWMHAAHGETLAANFDERASLRAFDKADTLIANNPTVADGPYVALDPAHLERWRGNALARLARPDAILVLQNAHSALDTTFTRARCGLLIDLATAFLSVDDRQQIDVHLEHGSQLASVIGSRRHLRRSQMIAREIRVGAPATTSRHIVSHR